MNFSSLMIPINSRSKGIIRFLINNKLDNLNLDIEFHKLLFKMDDPELINTLMKSIIDRCDVNPFNNDSIFNSISSNIINKLELNYFQIENLCEKINNLKLDGQLNDKIQISKDFFGVCTLISQRDVLRIKRYLNSFLSNYSILSDTLRYVEKRLETSTPKEEKTELLFNVEKKEIKTEVIEETTEISEKNSLIEEILDFISISPHIQGYLVHLICNYYRFFKVSKIEKNQDHTIIVSFGNMFQNDLVVNRNYTMGLINILEKINIETVNLLMRNLIKFISNQSDKLESVHIQSILFILYFFTIRYALETHREWVYKNLNNLFCDTTVQEKMLNNYISKVSSFPIKFSFVKDQEIEEQEINIEKISEKYNYLKELDQEKFIDLVFNDLRNNKDEINDDVVFGVKNIISIDKFLQNKLESHELIENTPPKNVNSLLTYKYDSKDKKIISEPFKHFLCFLNNPVYIVSNKNINIPNNILNSFAILKNVLNDQNFKKNNINTFDYYKKIVGLFPKDFQFSNILYIIFQIIIPYMYYFYEITDFEDLFLTPKN